MKLKDTFIVREMDGGIVLAALDRSFQGLMKGNASAAKILLRLQEETSKEQLVSLLTDAYEVDVNSAERDIDRLLDKLREVGALDEGEDRTRAETEKQGQKSASWLLQRIRGR